MQYNAGIQCELSELPRLFNRLLSDTEYKVTIEENSKKLIEENNNVEKYYTCLKEYYN